MNKIILSAILICAVLFTGCSASNPTQDNVPSSQAEPTLLNAVWPENEYTENIPVAPGDVSSVMLDIEKGYCSIFLEGLSENEYHNYIEALKESGFLIQNEVSEEVTDQNYVTVGTIFSNGEKGLSISYIPGNLGIYISFLK